MVRAAAIAESAQAIAVGAPAIAGSAQAIMGASSALRSAPVDRLARDRGPLVDVLGSADPQVSETGASSAAQSSVLARASSLQRRPGRAHIARRELRGGARGARVAMARERAHYGGIVRRSGAVTRSYAGDPAPDGRDRGQLLARIVQVVCRVQARKRRKREVGDHLALSRPSRGQVTRQQPRRPSPESQAPAQRPCGATRCGA